ncbi:MAG: hypothetical protein KGL35_00950 [Bradyrhizobium sp.]|nr:hypothetical protein [Bradyrhizobium sp.]
MTEKHPMRDVVPTYEGGSFLYSQEADCCDSGPGQELEIQIHDGGGGKFFRIKTNGWAIDSGADIEALLQKIRPFFDED